MDAVGGGDRGGRGTGWPRKGTCLAGEQKGGMAKGGIEERCRVLTVDTWQGEHKEGMLAG